MLEKRTIGAFRSLCILGAAAVITACSGGTNSSSPLPASATTDQAGTASPVSSTSPVTSQSVSTPAFSVVQTAHAGGTYNSAVTVKLSNAPAAGDVLVLFFETNRTSSFPYSGQVTWPASPTGSQWSYDGSTSGTTTILHHVVQSGESGSYTVNVGGTGSGWEDYVVAEVKGANPSNPVNARVAHSVAAGSTSYTFGSAGVTPTVAGTFPLAFFSPHVAPRTWSSVSSGWTIIDRNYDFTEMLATGPVQTGTAPVNATAALSSSSSYAGAADVVLLNPSGSATTTTPAPSSAPTGAPTTAPTQAPWSVAASQYVYPKGSTPNCNVYSPGDWLTADLVDAGGANSYVPTAKDPSSDTVTSYLQSVYGNIAWFSPTEETVNMVTSSTPTYALNTSNGHHEVSDLYGDSSNIPWVDGTSYVEYQKHTCSGGGDCHTNELNTSNCVSYENYTSATLSDMITSGTFNGGSGRVLNVRHPYNDQYQHAGALISFGGLPMMGTTAWGEDLNYQQPSCQPNCTIPHIIGFQMPINGGSQQGYTAPAMQGHSSCLSYCGHTIRAGARLVLRASFVCPSVSTNPQANLICNTLKKYGMIEDDTESNGCTVNQWGNRSDCVYGLRMGTSRNGTNPWKGSGCCPGAAPPYTTANSEDLDDILLPNGSHYMHMSDFYVISGGVSS